MELYELKELVTNSLVWCEKMHKDPGQTKRVLKTVFPSFTFNISSERNSVRVRGWLGDRYVDTRLVYRMGTTT